MTVSLVFLATQVTVHHLPDKVPSYTAVWGKYVPADYVQMGLENFTLVRSVDSGVIPQSYVIQLINPDVKISTDHVTSLLTVTMKIPNQTVDIAFLDRPTFLSLNNTLATKVQYTNETDGVKMYFVGSPFNNTVEFGWLAPVNQDNAVLFSLGYAQAETGVQAILNTVSGKAPSILSLSNVNKALYIMGGPEAHLAIGFINFQGVVMTSNLTGTSVDFHGGSVIVSNVVGFNDTVSAASQYNYVKSVYKTYTQFTVYDSYVNVQATRPSTDLTSAIRLVE